MLTPDEMYDMHRQSRYLFEAGRPGDPARVLAGLADDLAVAELYARTLFASAQLGCAGQVLRRPLGRVRTSSPLRPTSRHSPTPPGAGRKSSSRRGHGALRMTSYTLDGAACTPRACLPGTGHCPSRARNRRNNRPPQTRG